MDTQRLGWLRRWGAALLLGVTTAASVGPAQAAPWTNRLAFANAAFREVWNVSDKTVAMYSNSPMDARKPCHIRGGARTKRAMPCGC